MISLKKPIAFEWDEANQNKIWEKHKVSTSEVEEVFFYQKKKIATDFFHSKTEDRYILVGKTKRERAIFIVFTQRKNMIRVISARDLNKKEYRLLDG
jgi:uncharacterized protein